MNQSYSCNHKLIIFLLKLPEQFIQWDIFDKLFETTILNVLFNSDDIFELDNQVLNLLISNSSIDNKLWGHIDELYSTSVGASFLTKCKNSQMIKQIFDQGKIVINQKLILSNEKVSPIDCLVHSGNFECIEYLLKLGANLNTENIYNQLSHCDSVEIFKLFDTYNFDLMKKNNNGNLLFDTLYIRSEDVLEYFI